MDTLVVFGIGAAALGYLAYVVWRGVNGKGGCGCSSGGSCKKAGKPGSCCSTLGSPPKISK